MQLNHLVLNYVRAFDQVEFTFCSGMNLIVGINGVGKSTVLDVIRVMLAQALPQITAARASKLAFEPKDIQVGQEMLSAQLDFQAFNIDFQYLVQQPRSEYNSLSESSKSIEEDIEALSRERRIEERRLREGGYRYTLEKRQQLTPEPKSLTVKTKKVSEQPLAIYFSAHRSLSSDSKGKPTNAFSDSLEHRELRLKEFSSWWLAQNALAEESAIAQRHMNFLAEAVSSVLDTCSNVRAKRQVFSHVDSNGKTTQKEEVTLLIDKGDILLDVYQLSDGERSMLTLVLDLARRLSQANPKLSDPIKQGKAIVLIDEIGLHLHPRWQRTIVQRLTSTFPNCQFIATTHSPLVIGEVDPAGLILLTQENGQVNVVQDGLQGFGLDSSWILKHLMDTEPRNTDAQELLEQIENALEDGELDIAREHLKQYRVMIHGEDNEAMRLEASINNLEAFADEMDSEDE